jgi:hypothetical protein
MPMLFSPTIGVSFIAVIAPAARRYLPRSAAAHPCSPTSLRIVRPVFAPNNLFDHFVSARKHSGWD